MFQIRIVQPTAKQSYEKALKLVEEMDMSSDDEEEDSKLVKNVEGKLFFLS